MVNYKGLSQGEKGFPHATLTSYPLGTRQKAQRLALNGPMTGGNSDGRVRRVGSEKYLGRL